MLAVVVVLTGCGEGAKLVQRTDEGGIVTYPYKGTQGYLFTARRREAQALMRETCEGREYTVVREGEAKGRSRIVQDVAGGEIVTERRWGMEFRCK